MLGCSSLCCNLRSDPEYAGLLSAVAEHCGLYLESGTGWLQFSASCAGYVYRCTVYRRMFGRVTNFRNLYCHPGDGGLPGRAADHRELCVRPISGWLLRGIAHAGDLYCKSIHRRLRGSAGEHVQPDRHESGDNDYPVGHSRCHLRDEPECGAGGSGDSPTNPVPQCDSGSDRFGRQQRSRQRWHDLGYISGVSHDTNERYFGRDFADHIHCAQHRNCGDRGGKGDRQAGYYDGSGCQHHGTKTGRASSSACPGQGQGSDLQTLGKPSCTVCSQPSCSHRCLLC